MERTLKTKKTLLKLTWVVIKMSLFAAEFILNAAGGSSSRTRTKTYGHGQAYGLLYDDQITTAEFVDSISD